MNQPPAAESAIREKLSAYTDPYLAQTLGEAKAVESVVFREGQVSVELVLGFPCADYTAELKSALEAHLKPHSRGGPPAAEPAGANHRACGPANP